MESKEIDSIAFDLFMGKIKKEIYNPSYKIIFDEEAYKILINKEKYINSKNKNYYIAKLRAVGGLLGITSTNLIVDDNFKRRTEFLDFIFSQIPSSKILELYEITRNQYSKDFFDDKDIKILLVHNFKKNKDFIIELSKANEKGVFYRGNFFPQLTIFADTEASNVPKILRKNSLVIESCGLDDILNLEKDKMHNYILRQQRINKIKQDPKEIDNFINSITHNTQCDPPNKKNIIEYFERNKAINKIRLEEFLKNIEIVTTLNQNKKRYYIIPQEGKEDLKVILPHPVDCKYCFEMSENFLQMSLDLPKNYDILFNYINRWVQKEKKQDNFFVGPILTNDYDKYLQDHPHLHIYSREKDTYRKNLLTLSNHEKKGKYNLLILKPKEEKDFNKPNEYKLNYEYQVQTFNYASEKQKYYEEYFKFWENLIENQEQSKIKIPKSVIS